MYLGKIFEQVCLSISSEILPLNSTHFGRWWHKNKEIDLVAINEETKTILFAECKWKDNVDAKEIIKELKEKSKYVDWNNNSRKEHYAVFAKSFKEKIKNCYELQDIEKALIS